MNRACRLGMGRCTVRLRRGKLLPQLILCLCLRNASRGVVFCVVFVEAPVFGSFYPLVVANIVSISSSKDHRA